MRRISLLLLFMLCAAGAPTGQAGESFVVAYMGDSADHHAARAVMEEAYRRIGLPVEFKAYEAAAALAASDGGEVGAELQRIDGIGRRFRSLVQVPMPINYIQGLAFSRKYEFPIEGWHSLKPYRIGIVKGVLFAERGTEGMDVSVADTYPQLIEWIADDRVDVGVMPRISGLAALLESENEDVKALEGVLETLLLYHYVHRTHAEIGERLAPVLKKMLLDGTTQRLRKAANDRLLGRDE